MIASMCRDDCAGAPSGSIQLSLQASLSSLDEGYAPADPSRRVRDLRVAQLLPHRIRHLDDPLLAGAVVYGHELAGGADLAVHPHQMGKPDFLRVRSQYHGLDADHCWFSDLLEVAQMSLDGIERTAGSLKIVNADAEMLLQPPGAIAQRNQIAGFVQVAVSIQPMILQRL